MSVGQMSFGQMSVGQRIFFCLKYYLDKMSADRNACQLKCPSAKMPAGHNAYWAAKMLVGQMFLSPNAKMFVSQHVCRPKCLSANMFIGKMFFGPKT
jgi:hypothetical protein